MRMVASGCSRRSYQEPINGYLSGALQNDDITLFRRRILGSPGGPALYRRRRLALHLLPGPRMIAYSIPPRIYSLSERVNLMIWGGWWLLEIRRLTVVGNGFRRPHLYWARRK